MENFQNLTNLQELWLGRNRIKVVNLCGLKCIKKISLQSNRLTSTRGFEVCHPAIVRQYFFFLLTLKAFYYIKDCTEHVVSLIVSIRIVLPLKNYT